MKVVIFLFYFLSCSILFECKEVKIYGSEGMNSVLILTKKAYCGGNKPEFPRHEIKPLENFEFHVRVKKEQIWVDTNINLTTNDNGELTYNLPENEYGLFIVEKELPFEEFYLKIQKTNYNSTIHPGTRDCILNWYQKPDILLSVPNSRDTIIWTLSCYSGSNPCGTSLIKRP